jgi:glycosyltransferase involved in cell wall biosynthesis
MKPELLVIGPTYMFSINRRKLTALAEFFNVTCATSDLPDTKLFGKPAREYEAAVVDESLELHRFSEVPKARKFTRMIYRNLSRLFRMRRYDFILVETEPWALLKWQALILAKRFQPQAVFGEFSWENVERSGLVGLLFSSCYRLSSWLEDFSISGNLESRRIFLKHGMSPQRNLVAAQLGVDTRLFCPVSREKKVELRRSLGLPDEVFIIGYCGRLTEEKGLAELKEAVRQLYDENKRAMVAFLGDGPLSAELVKPGLALVLPSRPHSAIAGFMQALDLFVLPSKPLRARHRVWEEQFGHVLIEAMACGIPTFGSDSGAIPEVLADPDCIFAHSDVEALHHKLRQAIASPDWLNQLALKQRERVLEVYSHQAVARTYTEFLLRMLKERRRTRRESGG